MTLIVDLNPLTQKTYIIDNFTINKDNISVSNYYGPGGSGIDVVKLMGLFGEKTIITGFLGGVNGEFFHTRLQSLEIIHRFQSIKDETRMNVDIVDGPSLTRISEKGPRITREELGAFYELYLTLIKDVESVVLTGNIPPGISADMVFDLVNMAKRNGKKVILNVESRDFFLAIEAKPDMIFINKDTLEDFSNLILESDNDVFKVAKAVQEKFTGNLIINLLERGFLFIEDTSSYIVENRGEYSMDQVDNRALLAGLVTGVNRNYDMDMILRLGMAYNMAYSLDSTIYSVDMSLIKSLMKKVETIYMNI